LCTSYWRKQSVRPKHGTEASATSIRLEAAAGGRFDCSIAADISPRCPVGYCVKAMIDSITLRARETTSS